jgi:hypothetical protein
MGTRESDSPRSVRVVVGPVGATPTIGIPTADFDAGALSSNDSGRRLSQCCWSALSSAHESFTSCWIDIPLVSDHGQASQYGEVVIGLLKALGDGGGKPEVIALQTRVELALDPLGERIEHGQNLLDDRVVGQVGDDLSGLLEATGGGLCGGFDWWLDVADAGQLRDGGQGLERLVCLQRGVGEGGGMRGRDPLPPFRCRVRCGQQLEDVVGRERRHDLSRSDWHQRYWWLSHWEGREELRKAGLRVRPLGEGVQAKQDR